MTLIVQIVLGLLLLGGFVTIYLSSKNWHWTQIVLITCTLLAAVGFVFLGASTLAIHRYYRKDLIGNEKRIADAKKQNAQLLNGSENQPGILDLKHQLNIITRERGRVWRGVKPLGQINAQGQISVEFNQPAPTDENEKSSPHGISKDTILYVFATGNAADAADNTSNASQYLGELRVVAVQENGVTLEPVQLLFNRKAITNSTNNAAAWSLYESMPADRHHLYADLSDEQLRQLLPAESVEEYIRHGSKANDDDDEWHIAGYDEDGQRVGPNDMNASTIRHYDRSLRDYAYIFNFLAGEKVVMTARGRALFADIEKLKQALKSAKMTGEFRQKQIDAITVDLAGMKKDRAAMEAHLKAVQARLDQFEKFITSYQKANSARAKQFTQRQLSMVKQINERAPVPGS